ncbi:ABC transporter permease, partial [Haloarcula sp. AONF1]
MATETSESTETTGSTERLVGHQTVERLLGTSLYVVSGLLLLFLWVPLAIIIFLAFAENAVTIFPFEGLTLDNFRLALRSDSMRSSLVGSFTIATVAASIATILGVLASFALTRYRFRLREVYRTFGIIPMVIPGIILGVA